MAFQRKLSQANDGYVQTNRWWEKTTRKGRARECCQQCQQHPSPSHLRWCGGGHGVDTHTPELLSFSVCAAEWNSWPNAKTTSQLTNFGGRPEYPIETADLSDSVRHHTYIHPKWKDESKQRDCKAESKVICVDYNLAQLQQIEGVPKGPMVCGGNQIEKPCSVC